MPSGGGGCLPLDPRPGPAPDPIRGPAPCDPRPRLEAGGGVIFAPPPGAMVQYLNCQGSLLMLPRSAQSATAFPLDSSLNSIMQPRPISPAMVNKVVESICFFLVC